MSIYRPEDDDRLDRGERNYLPQTDTPRTDAAIIWSTQSSSVPASFARTLERELAAKSAECVQWENSYHNEKAYTDSLNAECDALRASCQRLREALVEARRRYPDLDPVIGAALQAVTP